MITNEKINELKYRIIRRETFDSEVGCARSIYSLEKKDLKNDRDPKWEEAYCTSYDLEIVKKYIEYLREGRDKTWEVVHIHEGSLQKMCRSDNSNEDYRYAMKIIDM